MKPSRAPIDNHKQVPNGHSGQFGPRGMNKIEYRTLKLKKIFKKL